MRYHYFFPLTIAAAVSMANPSQAAQPLPLYKVPLEKLKESFQLVVSQEEQHHVAAMHTLQLVSELTDRRQVSHIRMQQYYLGFPVHGGFAILHSKSPAKLLNSTSSPVQLTGSIYPQLDAELGPVQPSFRKNAQEALLRFKKMYQDSSVSEEQVTPMVYVDDNNQAHWAYKVSVLVDFPNDRPKRPTAIVDAQTYRPFVTWDDIKTLSKPVLGMGYGGNIKTGKYQYGSDLPYLQLTHNGSGFCLMRHDDVTVVDMDHKFYNVNKPLQFPCPKGPGYPDSIYNTGIEADGYDAINDGYSPSNDALYAGGIVSTMYKDWYKVPVLTLEDKHSPMPLILRVHYGANYENASWDGKRMNFGDGGYRMYPLVSLGITAHEISHGFTQQHSDLEYIAESGALNESFSDMAAQAAEFYASTKASWKIAAEIMKKEAALRFMDKPSKDGRSYDDASAYKTAAKRGLVPVHYGSGVFNHLFYILAHEPQWNIRKAFDVMVLANQYYWGPYEKFTGASCGLLYAAKDLGYSVAELQHALKEVAIDYVGCTVG